MFTCYSRLKGMVAAPRQPLGEVFVVVRGRLGSTLEGDDDRPEPPFWGITTSKEDA